MYRSYPRCFLNLNTDASRFYANVVPRFARSTNIARRSIRNVFTRERSHSTLTQRPIFYRVCDIPKASHINVTSFLSTLIQERLQPDEADIKYDITPIPSCYQSSSETASAIVNFENGTPNFLIDLVIDPLDMLHLETNGKETGSSQGREVSVTFDRHFHGFTQTYSPDPEQEITADIIAITGMDANAFASWTNRSNSCMWLKDFLPQDLPRCRTMVYGYNSKLTSWNMNQLSEYGREFFSEIGKVRYTDEQQKRPLIFIAHSFGGIVLAHCLIRAFRARDKKMESVYLSTYGILFFGTPHRGSVKEFLLKMVEEPGNPRQISLRQTEPGSDVLRMQLDDFTDIVGDRKIATFYETEMTPTPEKGPDGKFCRTGPRALQVTEASSILQLPIHTERKFPVNSNHSDMVKFKASSDQTYSTVIQILKEFEKAAPNAIADRYSASPNQVVPRFIVPFRQDQNFIGREDALRRLDEIFGKSEYHCRAGLVGLGGVGKSQIAVEYVWRLRTRNPTISVYWVHASTAARFNQSYREIAESLDLPDRDDPDADVLQLVCDYLSNKDNGEWIMILDNADDESIFFNAKEARSENTAIRQLADLLPQDRHGSILVTSRSKQATVDLVGGPSFMVDVLPMSEDDASMLLRNRSADQRSSEKDVKRLVRELGSIPLAVAQAAAFISRKSPRMTISRYLSIFQQSFESQTALMGQKIDEIQQYPSIPNAILTSWAISFDQIRERHPNSSELLATMSYLDPQAIPESLFASKFGKESLEFENRIGPLVSFSLISPDIGGTSFNMHRLVQLGTREWLKKHNEEEKWKQEALNLVVAAFPDKSRSGQSHEWALCEELSPHAESVLNQLPTSLGVRQNLLHVALLENTAFFADLKGDLNGALEKRIAAREILSEVYGWNHPIVIDTSSHISDLLSETGRANLAVRSLRANLKRRDESLGPDHRNSRVSLHTMAKLSELLREQGELDEAQSMGMRALEGLKQRFGPSDPSTLRAQRTCALLLQAKGRKESARVELEAVLQQRRVVLGPTNIDTITSSLDLGSFYTSQLKYSQALPFFQTATEILQKEFGIKHRRTVEAMKELENVITKNGKLFYSLMGGKVARAIRFVTNPFRSRLNILGTFTIIFYVLVTIVLFVSYAYQTQPLAGIPEPALNAE